MSTNWEELVSGEELIKASKERKEKYKYIKVDTLLVKNKEKDGWEIDKVYKNNETRMKKLKPIGDLFENEVWEIFYKMGFKVMNCKNDFKLDYCDVSSKQIDVVAIDEEVCLLIECKSTEKLDNKKEWKTDLESINGMYEGLRKEIRKKYPDRKVKYIFATKNYIIGKTDINRMENFQIINFDYETINYYKALVEHLGSAAKYQLLGNVFARTEIKGMTDFVPAIEGKMGGQKYYSFLIEPERLLKLAYVLHRNKANEDMMPTYQRLIKKERLKSVREFVNNGGYFPNSLIVSIDTNNKGIRFDAVSNKNDVNQSKIGLLYLPKNYQSLYVIDGQHRLYGYSESDYASKDAIPVVAFIDLKKEDQVKMFMDINENQKSVSKTLRNTLNIDLLWKSESYTQRQEALILEIGRALGENIKSPLYGRIVTGENTSNGKRCITLDYIKEAFKQSDFLNMYKKNKNEIIKRGIFDKIDNDETKNILYPFICKCLKLISEYCSVEWEKGNEGYLTINNTMFAILKILNDIVNIVIKNEDFKNTDDYEWLYSKCQYMLIALGDTINNLAPESAKIIKSAKGGGAKKVAWRELQVALHNRCQDFINDELSAYIKENCQNNNPLASDYIARIENKLVFEFKNKMMNIQNWQYQYLPEKLRNELYSKTSIENRDRNYRGISEKVEEWNFISFKEIKEISSYKSNWSLFCSEILSKNELSKSKTDTLMWLAELDSMKNRIANGEAIKTSEFEKIEIIFNSFCKEKSMVEAA